MFKLRYIDDSSLIIIPPLHLITYDIRNALTCAKFYIVTIILCYYLTVNIVNFIVIYISICYKTYNPYLVYFSLSARVFVIHQAVKQFSAIICPIARH